jgi:uncharacterized membrane protein (DUF106 family)
VKSHESATGPIIGVLVTCALVIFFVVMIYRRTKDQKRRRYKTSVIEFAHIHEQSERSPSQEEVDFEGTMEEVELL